MNSVKNPFEYDAASNLSPNQILEYYIEDYNYSRFIQSRRNIFLVGERGCGKTMTLLYNSYRVQCLRAEQEGGKISLDLIGVYVPCNTPLTHKQEYRLLDEYRAAVLSEHYLTLSLLFWIADTLSRVPGLGELSNHEMLRGEMEFVLGRELPRAGNFFESLRLFAQGETAQAQKSVNSRGGDSFYQNALSFSMVIMPLMDFLRTSERLADSHFMLMLDDAHDLNPYQVKALNSWIAYRDHSAFSFKVATSKAGRPDFQTASGGSILEGHDFTTIDMEQSYQFELSNFGRLAGKVVQRRLERAGIACTPEEFFPINKKFAIDLSECEARVRERAKVKYINGTGKQVGDYVYKFGRAEYFRSRSPKANRPPYSGFETIVYLSTGVIRNLLEPCYWMFDQAVSHGSEGEMPLLAISSEIQAEIIMQHSERKWDWLKVLYKVVDGCSSEDARRIANLMDGLAMHFRERLLYHESEPRANSFTISALSPDLEGKLMPLLGIARRAQVLYVRPGPAKDGGRREDYYVPNRMLWPARGLDPVGQHARVSIRASELWKAAEGGKIVFRKIDSDQEGLFGEGHSL